MGRVNVVPRVDLPRPWDGSVKWTTTHRSWFGRRVDLLRQGSISCPGVGASLKMLLSCCHFRSCRGFRSSFSLLPCCFHSCHQLLSPHHFHSCRRLSSYWRHCSCYSLCSCWYLPAYSALESHWRVAGPHVSSNLSVRLGLVRCSSALLRWSLTDPQDRVILRPIPPFFSKAIWRWAQLCDMHNVDAGDGFQPTNPSIIHHAGRATMMAFNR